MLCASTKNNILLGFDSIRKTCAQDSDEQVHIPLPIINVSIGTYRDTNHSDLKLIYSTLSKPLPILHTLRRKQMRITIHSLLISCGLFVLFCKSNKHFWLNFRYSLRGRALIHTFGIYDAFKINVRKNYICLYCGGETMC